MCSNVAPLAPKWCFNAILCYMPLCTTIVACFCWSGFPCLPVVLVIVVIVGSILIVVCTLILVLSLVCIPASVQNVAIRATGYCGLQWWALVCYFYEPSIDLLVCLGYGAFKSDGVPITLVILVISQQCWCYERDVFPSCPVLTMSRRFVVGPGRLSGIAFIINAGEVGLGCLPRSRQSVAMVAVLAEGAVGGTEWAVCVVTVSIVASGGSGPDGKAVAMMLSAFLCAASAILSASTGLVINWFTGLVVGVWVSFCRGAINDKELCLRCRSGLLAFVYNGVSPTINALVVGNRCYILQLSGLDLHGPTSPFLHENWASIGLCLKLPNLPLIVQIPWKAYKKHGTSLYCETGVPSSGHLNDLDLKTH